MNQFQFIVSMHTAVAVTIRKILSKLCFTFVSFSTNTTIYDSISVVVSAFILWSVKHVNCRNGRHLTFIPFKLLHLYLSLIFLSCTLCLSLIRFYSDVSLCTCFSIYIVDGPYAHTKQKRIFDLCEIDEANEILRQRCDDAKTQPQSEIESETHRSSLRRCDNVTKLIYFKMKTKHFIYRFSFENKKKTKLSDFFPVDN